MRHALQRHPEIFNSRELTCAPVALFYDLDVFDELLTECKESFPPHFRHFLAAKANPVLSMLGHAHSRGFGVECASIGELLLATRRLGLNSAEVVFDSPAKTRQELEYAVHNSIRCHLDNFDEFDRVVEIVQGSREEKRPLGFRVNPASVGEGSIAALSVSTPDSKFGVDISDPATRSRLVDAYVASPFLDSIHVHVGSGGMSPETQLADGIRAALDVALDVNKKVQRKQIEVVDIGGGLPGGFFDENLPDFRSYSRALSARCPELFTGEYTVLTEFGQALNAKAGFLASRIEFVKKDTSRTSHLAVVHYGADVCVRQAYTDEHPRRFATFEGHDANPKDETTTAAWSVGGPLCFQGDFIARELALPQDLRAGDFVVMKDAGANTLSLFSRHCSRFAPPVYGFRWEDPRQKKDIKDMVLIKPRENLDSLANFWGAQHLARSDDGETLKSTPILPLKQCNA